MEKYPGWRRASVPVEEWFQGLPLYEWVPLHPRPGEEAAFVRLLCLLYIDGRINLTFSRDMDAVMRGALTDQEHEAWCESHYPQPRKKN